MFEKVNPCHPDKIADRIAGAIVDLWYSRTDNPKIAVEVLIGHGKATIIIEAGNFPIDKSDIKKIVKRIAGKVKTRIIIAAQDKHLNGNQQESIKCGDNGIFMGVPVTKEQETLTKYALQQYKQTPYDGKYVIENKKIISCQSNADKDQVIKPEGYSVVINPLGYWTGGINVDTGATNRKLGSDMGDAITGGGLHGKDLSKADVSVNIYAHIKAQETGKIIKLHCAIGDECVDGKPYSEIVDIAKKYINKIGGFEKFAEWGLIR